MVAKILKSKFYICECVDSPGPKRIVRPEFGAFDTDSRAFDFMLEKDPNQDLARPGCILMRRKAEFKGFTTAKGARILKAPHVWKVPD